MSPTGEVFRSRKAAWVWAARINSCSEVALGVNIDRIDSSLKAPSLSQTLPVQVDTCHPTAAVAQSPGMVLLDKQGAQLGDFPIVLLDRRVAHLGDVASSSSF